MVPRKLVLRVLIGLYLQSLGHHASALLDMTLEVLLPLLQGIRVTQEGKGKKGGEGEFLTCSGLERLGMRDERSGPPQAGWG